MLTLGSGENAVVVVPENGAGLLSWTFAGEPVLRPAVPGAAILEDAHELGWFPLVPYANRIAMARFHWKGQSYQLLRNFGDSPHSIHGVGWRSAWTVGDVAADSVTLSLAHQPDESWPFAFEATVGYQVSDRGVTLALAVTNHHHDDAPAGLGLHPFFPRTHDPALAFRARDVWENAPDALPIKLVPIPPEWDYTQPRRVADSRLDNCFTGWDRVARTEAGPVSLRIEASDAFRHAQVFTPHWTNFFCFEPVTHVPDAINRPDLPPDQAMNVLRPGETLRGTIRMSLIGGG